MPAKGSIRTGLPVRLRRPPRRLQTPGRRPPAQAPAAASASRRSAPARASVGPRPRRPGRSTASLEATRFARVSPQPCCTRPPRFRGPCRPWRDDHRTWKAAYRAPCRFSGPRVRSPRATLAASRMRWSAAALSAMSALRGSPGARPRDREVTGHAPGRLQGAGRLE